MSDISAISNINPSTINRLLIRNSPNLAICSLPNLCSFLAGASYGGGAQEVWNELLTSPLSQDKYFIGGNAPGCNTYPEIMFNCGTVNNKISGTVKFHQQAGCQDSGTPAEGIEIISTDATGMQNITFTKPDGTYELYVPPGSYTTKAIVQSPFTATAPLTNTFTGTGAAFVAPFCISSSQTIQDVNVAIYPVQPARPGFDATYKIRIENTGTVAKSGTVSFQFDTAKQELVSFSTQPANYTDGNATWNFQLNPLSTRTITAILKVKAPPINNNGDTMTLTSALLPVGVDATPANNTYTLSQVLVGSYDPNDKAVLQGSQVLIGDADEYLTYKIRFQNTGTASAIFVKLQDQLDDKLDWSTFRPVSASHENYRLKIADGLLTVEFNNINLPPKSVDDAGSNGFFMYKIKPKNNVLLNDTIENTASIYFDYNAPIITNTVTTKYVEALSVARNELDDLAVYPNPANSKLNFMSAVTISSVEIYNNLGQKVHSNKGDNIIDADVSTLAEGIYICHIKTGDGKSAKRKIIISK
ncbi:T9SS type A sorting domain-containing protein [Flavobacterium sp. J372]|uniref:T9SS type A sorting domain-containing protein n=1 Tax=Flavobacterium sp. J372 TaxID=2898436 RepID=UPI002151B062|nr:T9SS type A sorting domain-containing protein [Flavobacterium sp. J372]MCR5863025.1 T9SS type A sorting domain-containing protein [Flavobacterium sp. J372]